MIEQRECIIYEIVDRKVGQSRKGESRPISQLKEGEDWRILQTIPPGVLTQREVWETEREWQITKGYSVENEGNWKRLEHTLNEDRGWINDKIALTKSDPVWKETVGIPAAKKSAANRDMVSIAKKTSKTKQSEKWQTEVEPERLNKFLSVIHSEEWQNENFIECPYCQLRMMPGGGYKNHVERCNSNPNAIHGPMHTNDVLERVSKKVSDTRNSSEWKAKHHKICPYCGKGPMDPGNYTKHVRKCNSEC